MTISNQNLRNDYSADGATVAFAYTFRILDDDDIKVIHTDSDGVETVLTKTTHYTISGVGDSGGGTVTTVSTYPATDSISLVKDPALIQSLDLKSNRTPAPETIELALDRLEIQIQAFQEKFNRALKVSQGTSTTIAVLPTPSAGKALVWNSTLDGLENSSIGTSIATGNIEDDAVTGAKIAAEAIDSEHYVDGSIDAVHLAANIVNADKMDLTDDYNFTGALQVSGADVATESYVDSGDSTVQALIPTVITLGARTSKSFNTDYLAATAGIVTAKNTTTTSLNRISGYTDSNSSPTTKVTANGQNSDGTDNGDAGISFPVISGEYYRVDDDDGTGSTMYFQSLTLS